MDPQMDPEMDLASLIFRGPCQRKKALQGQIFRETSREQKQVKETFNRQVLFCLESLIEVGLDGLVYSMLQAIVKIFSGSEIWR